MSSSEAGDLTGLSPARPPLARAKGEWKRAPSVRGTCEAAQFSPEFRSRCYPTEIAEKPIELGEMIFSCRLFNCEYSIFHQGARFLGPIFSNLGATRKGWLL